MADRFFRNEMPDYVPDTESVAAPLVAGSDSLAELLRLPSAALALELKKAGLELKNKVVKETWLCKSGRVDNYSLYTGALGTAFLLFKAYQISGDTNDIILCSDIIKACESASRGSRKVTFICGIAGIYALGAVVSHHIGDKQLYQHYLKQFQQIELSNDVPDELLFGRAGFLWACRFLNKNVGEEVIPSTKIRSVVDEMVNSGKRLATGNCPLMYEYHGKKYLGAAHGIAGILHVLMETDLKPDEAEAVKATLRYLIETRFPSGGNYPSSLGNDSDLLVHWCHGAPGIVLTLVKAAEFFHDDGFAKAAAEAAEGVVWKRGLLRRVGICHGISGNAYAFLSLYRATRKAEHLHRAEAFACFLRDQAERLVADGEMHGGDAPYSLFEGIGGMAYLFLDMAGDVLEAKFPGTAFLLFKAYQLSGDTNDVILCSDIIKACESACRGYRKVIFICGIASIYTLGAVVSHHIGDKQLYQRYLKQFQEIELWKDVPDELLFGRAGFLWACRFLNKNIGEEVIPSTKIRSVVDEMVNSGKRLATGNCPLSIHPRVAYRQCGVICLRFRI